jgi:hypothetical protein
LVFGRIFKSISVYYHTVAVDTNGEVFSWGRNDHGEVCFFRSFSIAFSLFLLIFQFSFFLFVSIVGYRKH